MADSKINILGIVPYESMKNVLLRAAETIRRSISMFTLEICRKELIS